MQIWLIGMFVFAVCKLYTLFIELEQSLWCLVRLHPEHDAVRTVQSLLLSMIVTKHPSLRSLHPVASHFFPRLLSVHFLYQSPPSSAPSSGFRPYFLQQYPASLSLAVRPSAVLHSSRHLALITSRSKSLLCSFLHPLFPLLLGFSWAAGWDSRLWSVCRQGR